VGGPKIRASLCQQETLYHRRTDRETVAQGKKWNFTRESRPGSSVLPHRSKIYSFGESEASGIGASEKDRWKESQREAKEAL